MTILTSIPSLILLGLVILLAIGAFLLLLSGFTLVPSGMIAVTEKIQKPARILKSGLHYLIPFAERKVGQYRCDAQTIRGDFPPFVLDLKYQIDDANKYHYSGHDFTVVLTEKLMSVPAGEFTDIVRSTANDYGIKILELQTREKGE